MRQFGDQIDLLVPLTFGRQNLRALTDLLNLISGEQDLVVAASKTVLQKGHSDPSPHHQDLPCLFSLKGASSTQTQLKPGPAIVVSVYQHTKWELVLAMVISLPHASPSCVFKGVKARRGSGCQMLVWKQKVRN